MTSRLAIPAIYTDGQLIDADHMNTYVRTNLSSIDSGYGCRVATTTSQDITPTDTWTALSFNAETFDDDTMHDNSTNNSRITIKSAGRYLVTGSALYTANNGSGNRMAAIYVNGSLYSYGSSRIAGSATNVELLTICDVIVLAVNDYVQFFVQHTNTTNTLPVGRRHFSVTKYV